MTQALSEIFDTATLADLFPATRSDEFFEALFGDAAEGAYDIRLKFAGSSDPKTYNFELHLQQRPGKCLACNLTYGLPEVFSRHPVINLKGLATDIAAKISLPADKVSWRLGVTKTISKELHVIPLTISSAG